MFLASASDADATGSLWQIEKQLINVNQSDIPADLRDQSNTALRFRNRWPDGKACIAGTEKLAMTAKSDRTPAPFPQTDPSAGTIHEMSMVDHNGGRSCFLGYLIPCKPRKHSAAVFFPPHESF